MSARRALPMAAALLALAGCGGMGGPTLANLNLNPNHETPADVPPDVFSVPNIPVPSGANLIEGDTVVVGQDETWTGQLVMTVPYTNSQMTQYYRQEMPKQGWEETAIVRARRTSISFVRGDRVATVRIAPAESGRLDIDIVVAPRGTPSGTGTAPASSRTPPPPRR